MQVSILMAARLDGASSQRGKPHWGAGNLLPSHSGCCQPRKHKASFNSDSSRSLSLHWHLRSNQSRISAFIGASIFSLCDLTICSQTQHSPLLPPLLESITASQELALFPGQQSCSLDSGLFIPICKEKGECYPESKHHK